MGDGTEGFANIGRVGYVALGAEKDGPEAACVGRVSEVRVSGFFGSVGRDD